MDVVFAIVACAALSQDAPSEAASTRPSVTIGQITVTTESRSKAERVAKRAAESKRALYLQWIGTEPPAKQCPIHIDIDFSRVRTAGETQIYAKEKMRSYRIRVVAPDEDQMMAYVRHELAHVVLDEAFDGQIPPWADEGIALIAEGEESTYALRRILYWHCRGDSLPQLASVLSREKLTERDYDEYAAAYMLSAFLVEKSGERELLRFATSASKNGVESALRSVYEIPNLATLQTEWNAWVAKNTQAGSKVAAEEDQRKPRSLLPIRNQDRDR